jgi:hypothetical protein
MVIIAVIIYSLSGRTSSTIEDKPTPHFHNNGHSSTATGEAKKMIVIANY